MKKLIILFAILSFWACNSAQNEAESNTNKENATSGITSREEFNDLSIYNISTVWNTQHGEEITFKDLEGHVLAVVMVYTSCKTACPRLAADMRNIEKQVSAKNKMNVKYVLISIDPEMDTPERLTQFGKDYKLEGDQWLFLQGTEETVREFANVVAVKYKEISPMDFSHSNIISVFDAEGVMQHQQEGLNVDNKETVAKIIELSK
ncbi:SCO family protein [Marivirga sp. S37H4]|uniref:SCO family protein n=1 Tax=Marivirga aurantiaca TaxID=2802615 RepID=A0A934WW24_9BACT|nr:SCO family protein [Marivirga aurantiaca]MBK6263992.1 SCO family protein [Marivirga aurantiaca]